VPLQNKQRRINYPIQPDIDPTFLKRIDAVTWAQKTETKIKQSMYFPDRLIASEKYTLGDLLDRYNRGPPREKSQGSARSALMVDESTRCPD